MTDITRILVLASGQDLIGSVNGAALRLPAARFTVCEPKPASMLNGELKGCETVLSEVDMASSGALGEFQTLTRKVGERCRVIAAARNAEGEDVRRLFRAGAVDVLIPPFTSDAVRGVFSELFRGANMRNGHVTAVVKAGGGVGATLLALNLASVMSAPKPKLARPARSAVVLDFDLQFGGCALALDLKPRHTILDAIKEPARVDGHFFDALVTEVREKFGVLAAPPEVVPQEAMDASLALRLVDEAAASHDLVFIDLPLGWSDWTLPVLHRADAVVLVATATVGGAAGASRVLAAFKQARLDPNLLFLINHLAGSLEGKERADRISRVLDIPVGATLAEDPSAIRAADRGRLVVDVAPNSRLSRDIVHASTVLDERLSAISEHELVRG